MSVRSRKSGTELCGVSVEQTEWLGAKGSGREEQLRVMGNECVEREKGLGFKRSGCGGQQWGGWS